LPDQKKCEAKISPRGLSKKAKVSNVRKAKKAKIYKEKGQITAKHKKKD